ncbi:MAG: hypothetical protein J6P69_07490 [Bacteroidales bacterium]|nr:hypothetical protein [Bacteroidales bacterium]MBP5690346.1 hypothetical protein [Bacteroidales bacterium]
MEDLILKQKAFFESGNTLDTRSRRAIVQILANTVKDVCGSDPLTDRFNSTAQYIRKNLYKWTGTGRLRMLLSLFAKPATDGPVPLGTVLIDASGTDTPEPALTALAYALAAGNTAVVLIPDTAAGETVRRIVDETFTDDFVAAVPAGTADASSADFVYKCGSSLPHLGREGFQTFSKMYSE